MTIEEIKSLLKSGDIAGAEAAAQELLAAEPDNVQAMMLYGTCCQLQGDEATFRDTYAAVKEHLDARPDALDAETKAAWERFDGLYAKLDQPKVHRLESTPHKSVLMEYVVLAVLVAAAIVTGIWFFDAEVRAMFGLAVYDQDPAACVDHPRPDSRGVAVCCAAYIDRNKGANIGESNID